MRGGEGDTHPPVREHHHGQGSAVRCGEIFGVASEGDTSIVDDTLVHRAR